MVTPDRVRGGASRRALRCLPRDWKQGYTRTETRPVYRCGDYANRWHTSVVLLLNKSGGGQGRGERIWHADARIKFAGRKRRASRLPSFARRASIVDVFTRTCAPCVRVRAKPRADVVHRYADVCISKAWLSLRGGETLTTAWKTSLNRFDGIEGNIFSDGNHRSFRCRRALWGKRRRCERIADAKSWREQLVTRGHAEEEASAMGENGWRDSATRRYETVWIIVVGFSRWLMRYLMKGGREREFWWWMVRY